MGLRTIGARERRRDAQPVRWGIVGETEREDTPWPRDQRPGRHASVTTTQRYDRRGDEVMRKATDTLHFPTGRDIPWR